MARAKRSKRSKYVDTLHVKCVAFDVHAYRDTWSVGDDKTCARKVIKWDTTALPSTDIIVPASSEAFLQNANRWRTYRINGVLIEYKPFRVLAGS